MSDCPGWRNGSIPPGVCVLLMSVIELAMRRATPPVEGRDSAREAQAQVPPPSADAVRIEVNLPWRWRVLVFVAGSVVGMDEVEPYLSAV